MDLQTGKDEDGTTREAPPICAWIDVIAPVLLTILQWPSEPLPNGKTAPPFYGGMRTDSMLDSTLLPFVIVSALVPPAAGLFAMGKPADAGTNEPAPKEVKDPFADYYGPIIQMVSGIVNTAIGTAYSVKTKADGATIAGGVLGNLSYMFAVLAQRYVNEAAEDVPVMIKMLVDATGNIGAAICIAEG